MQPNESIDHLSALLEVLEGQPYKTYQTLLNRTFHYDHYCIHFVHIQDSPGAFPATVCRITVNAADLGFSDACFTSKSRKLAAADYLLRQFLSGVNEHARQNRGVQGSGSFQPLSLPPQVLERNLIRFKQQNVQFSFRVSLPGDARYRILGHQTEAMFINEIPAIIRFLKMKINSIHEMKHHLEVVEDMMVLQEKLCDYGLVAFIADGSILPRRSGISQAPLKGGATVFHASKDMAVEVVLPNAGRIRGLGIRPGVNVVIGGGFHGKSTLLNAIVDGIYPHVPGDGRERVVTHPDTVYVGAEVGRRVNGLDISCFINNLPGDGDAEKFFTDNAGGSTSQAAGIVEAVLAGAGFLLIDEDFSATNFLIKDRTLRTLIPVDTITPLFDRIKGLYKEYGVSSMVVVGGSSEYLGVADHVIAMENYLPRCVTRQVRRMELPKPEKALEPLSISDNRRVLPGNFDPSFHVRRMAKTIPVRIKSLRLQYRILEYGNQKVDLTRLVALKDPYQVLAIGYAMMLARDMIKDESLSLDELSRMIYRRIEKESLHVLSQDENKHLFFAMPRRLELTGAINRLRNLQIDF